jgi:hypothetical protein
MSPSHSAQSIPERDCQYRGCGSSARTSELAEDAAGRNEDEKTALLANLRRLGELISSIILPRLEYWRMLPSFRFDRLSIIFAATSLAW